MPPIPIFWSFITGACLGGVSGMALERAFPGPYPPDAPFAAPSAPPLPCEPLDCPERAELLVLRQAFELRGQSVRNLEKALKECRAKPAP